VRTFVGLIHWPFLPLCGEGTRMSMRLETTGSDMATQRIVLGLAIAIGGVAILTGAHAQDNRGTMEQQMACTPDVWRLCSAQIPDVDRIVACLNGNTAQLSPPCRAVFVSDNDAPPQQTGRARGRVNQPRPQYDAARQPPPQYDPVPQRGPRYDPVPQRRPTFGDDDE
jgi:hypothetical protein